MNDTPKEIDHHETHTMNASKQQKSRVGIHNIPNQSFHLLSITHVVDGGECVAQVWLYETSVGQDSGGERYINVRETRSNQHSLTTGRDDGCEQKVAK